MTSPQAKTTALTLWLLAAATLFMLAESRTLNLESCLGTLAIAYLLSLSVLRYHPR